MKAGQSDVQPEMLFPNAKQAVSEFLSSWNIPRSVDLRDSPRIENSATGFCLTAIAISNQSGEEPIVPAPERVTCSRDFLQDELPGDLSNSLDLA